MMSLYQLFLAFGSILVISFLLILSSVITCRFRAQKKRRSRRRSSSGQPHRLIIALFHPYCSSGGGGERVLWKIVQVILLHSKRRRQQQCEGSLSSNTDEPLPFLTVLIYTVDPPSPSYKQDLLKHVKDRFAFDLTENTNSAGDDYFVLDFIHLHEYRDLLSPSPRLSLLSESLKTAQLAWKALTYSWDLVPDIFVDTTGYAFTYFVANLCMGCRVWAYVHYPTISTDMLQLVWQRRRSAYNHAAYIAQSKLATYAKLVYYCIFAVLYGIAGSMAHVVLVNSTWTYNHISFLWKLAAWQSRIQVVYPPCQVSEVLQQKQIAASAANTSRQNVVLSIGQFRPEKDHALQIEAIARFLELYPTWRGKLKLVLLGSCRGTQDQERLGFLRDLATEKYQLIEERDIEFVVNQPYSVVQEWLSKSSIGIHTMWNEHFGIGIVEMMAAGLVVVAHDSGGPKSDIVVCADQGPLISGGSSKSQPNPNTVGFLASSRDEYAESIHRILTMDPQEVNQIRMQAQKSSLRFSDNVFSKNMERIIASQIDPK